MNFLDDDVSINGNIDELVKEVDREIVDITARLLDSELDEESKQVVITISGYRQPSESWKCCNYNGQLFAKENVIYQGEFLEQLSRGDLNILSI